MIWPGFTEKQNVYFPMLTNVYGGCIFGGHCDILDREMMRILSRNPASIEILVENELVI